MPRVLLILALGSLAFGVASAVAPPAAVAAGRKGKKAKKAAKKARRYEKKGKKAYKKKRFDDAIVAFELAYEAVPTAKYLFNIGRCWEKKGDLFKAMEFIQRYVAEVEEEGEKEDAREVYEILRGKLLRTSGELTIDSDPEGAAVRLVGEGDREVAGTTPMTRWLQAGRWRLQVATKGLQIHEAEVFVAVGETAERFIELKEIVEEAPATEQPEGSAQAAKSRAVRPAKSRETPASYSGGVGWPVWAALGGGAALVAGGAVLGVLGQAEADKVDEARSEPGASSMADAQDAADAADAFALGANVLLGVGGAALVTGAVLWATSDASVRPMPGGVVLQGRW